MPTILKSNKFKKKSKIFIKIFNSYIDKVHSILYDIYNDYATVDGRLLLEAFCEFYIKKHLDHTKNKNCLENLVDSDGYRSSTKIILKHMDECKLHSYKNLLPFLQ